LYCVLSLLASTRSVNMYSFVCLGIHFPFLFTDVLIHVYLLIYILIYSVGFCQSGQAPISLSTHDHNHAAFQCWQQLYLGQYWFSCGAAPSFITAPSRPLHQSLIVLCVRHQIIGGRHQIVSKEWTLKCHMTAVMTRGESNPEVTLGVLR
jgi:hypothetical protein